MLALGRPGTPGDARAVALGLRSKRCADSVREYVGELQALLPACRLVLPDLAALGVELPSGLAPALGRST